MLDGGVGLRDRKVPGSQRRACLYSGGMVCGGDEAAIQPGRSAVSDPAMASALLQCGGARPGGGDG